MEFFFKCISVLIVALLLIFQPVNGQEHINPAKNVSVSPSADTLLFKELVSNKLRFKLPVKDGSASRYLKFSPSGNFLITSGTGAVTNLYRVEKDTATLAASFPVPTEESVFSNSEKELFLLHSRSLFKIRLSSYSIPSGEKLADATLPPLSHDLAIDASDSLLAFCESTNIRTHHTSDLELDNVYWQGTPQRLLNFNPAVADQAASVSKENHIQIRSIKTDSVLMEINAHRSKIVWIGYDPTGNLLASLDKQGYLFTWMPSSKQSIAQFKGVGGIPVFNPDGTLNLSSKGKGEEPGFVKPKKNTRQDSLNIQNNYLQTSPPAWEIFNLPILGYSPETGIRVGSGLKMMYHHKPDKDQKVPARPSVIMPKLAYGFKNNQIIAALETDIYAIKGWQLHSNLRYSINEANYFFGIGDRSVRGNRQQYMSNSFRVTGSMFKLLNSAYSAGLAFSIQHDTPLDFEKPAESNPDGTNGGWTTGIGPAFRIDNRNNIQFPTKGNFFDAAYYRYGLGQTGDYQYNEIKLDYRKYFSSNLLVKGSVFAFQALFNGTWGGTVPFYKLPYITDDRALRGMWRNLYIDRQIMSVQGEFRSFFSPQSTRYGYAVFGGAADGASNFLNNYKPDLKLVYGAGLRMQLIPMQRLDVRIDGVFNNKGDVGVYGGIGVSF